MEDENENETTDKPEGDDEEEEENEKPEEDEEEVNVREDEEQEMESEEDEDDAKSKGSSKDKEEIDPRISILEDVLIKAIRIKPDKFQRLMANPDLGGLVFKFLNDPEERIMIFNLSPAQAFLVFLEHQNNLKSKIVYFIRRAAEKVTVENFFDLLQIGEASSQPLEELEVIVQDMLLPILSNPNNTKNWPQFAVDDAIKHVHEMSNKIYVLKGRMKGQILLPMPLGIERIDKAIENFHVTSGQDQDLVLKSAIDDGFIEWSKLITETLEIRSTIAFLDDKQPTPMEEITFWNKRLKNLEGIFGQLRDQRVRKMATYLELCQSIYLKCFKDLFNNVVSGLTECRDICVYLRPLVKYFDLLDSTEIYDCGQYLHRLWHVICLVWSNSSYYRTTSKIIVLLREICNLLIRSCSKTLDPATLFQGEVEDCIKNIERSLEVFSLNLKLFFEYKDKIHTYFPSNVEPKLWVFHHKIVFSRYIRFVRRLENILEIFKTTDDFLKLEKIVFGGIKGRQLTAKIEKMFEEFSVTYSYFTGIPYDPLDPEEEHFDKDYAKFKKQIAHYDNSLASILTLAYEECLTTESIYKFFNMCGPILERPIIKEELFPKYSNIYKLLHKELDKVKELFDEALELHKHGHLMVDKNFPPLAGTILFLRKLDARITPSINEFKTLDPKLVEEQEPEYAFKKHQQMVELMNKFENKIFHQWASVVGHQIETNLAKPLKKRDKLNFLSLNFDPQLVAALREVRYLKEMNKEGIPEVALKLDERAEELFQWIYHLNLIVKWYNDLRRTSRPAEYIMVEHEIEAIDSIIDIALETLDWNMPNSWDYIMYVFDKLEDIYKRVRGAQENLDKISALLEPYSEKSLFERMLDEEDEEEEDDGYEDSEDEGAKLFPIEIIIEAKGLIILSDREERVAKRYKELQEISEILHDLKIENYNYFLNIKPEPEVSEDEPDTDEDEIMEAQAKEEEEDLTKEDLERIAEETAQRRADRLQRNEAREIRREERAQREEERLRYANLSPEEKKLFLIEKHNMQEEEAAEAAEEEETAAAAAAPTAAVTATAATPEGKKGKKKKKKKEAVEEVEESPNPLWPPPAIPPPVPQYITVVAQEAEDEPLLLGPAPEEKISDHEEEEPAPFDFAYAMAMEDKWLVYLNFLDSVVQDYLRKAVQCSLNFLEHETDEQLKRPPLFLIELALHEPNIVYVPTLVTDDPADCFYGLIWSLLKNITMMASQVKRIYHVNSEFENYYKSVKRDPDIKNLRRIIKQRTRDAMYAAVAYADTYQVHSYLWLTDRQLYLSQFLEYSKQLTPNDLALIEKKNPENPGPPKCKPTIEKFKEMIDFYNDLHTQLESIELEHIIQKWLKIDVRSFRDSVLETVYKWRNLFIEYLSNQVFDSIEELYNFVDEALSILSKPVLEDDYDALLKCMGCLFKVRERQVATDIMFEPLWEIIDLLKTYDVYFDEEQVLKRLLTLPEYWEKCKKLAATVKNQITPLIQKEAGLIVKRQGLFMIRQKLFRKTFLESELFHVACKNVYIKLDEVNKGLVSLENILNPINESCAFFDVEIVEFKDLNLTRKDLKNLKLIWDYFLVIQSCIEEWKKTPWKKIDVESMENECKKFVKELKQLDKDIRGWELYASGETVLKNLLTSLRAVSELQNPAIRDRHWKELMEATKVKFQMDDKTTLADLLVLKLHEYEEEVKFIVDKSVKEMAMEKILHEINSVWGTMEFEYDTHPRTNLKLLHPSEELIETLEEHQVSLQNMLSSKYIAFFLEEVSAWQQKLSYSDQIIGIWFEVQRTWSHLEAIFIGSEDIRNQLPEDSRRFDALDRTFKENLGELNKVPNVIKTTNRPGLYEKLERIQSDLALCEKALSEYLETKRLAFPRFYFISSADLLDILSNGNQPDLVCRHLTKLFDSINKLKFDSQGSKFAKGMFAKDGEYTDIAGGCECSGKVERWLNNVIDAMRRTIRYYLSVAITDYADKAREKWLYDHIAQPALVASQIWWSTEVNYAFTKFEEGYENSIKDYSKKQIAQLNTLINLLCGELTQGDRQKTMTICTIDVHARDVVIKLITNKIESASAFQWQAQLRHRWDIRQKDCFCNICDAQFRYQYEYLGNTPRLVITPLTDRCYITLTQSLHLVMGSAPAGPAGTGKTETTKDLGRAMGLMVYVYNCSEQMDYQSCGDIYKGLAQTGAWGCFDEFNRIAIEVLSVVAVQVKSILDALKLKKTSFNFLGEHINLANTIGLFITMNPGYAGRTELPENLKALFRPCAMVVPDFALICEIMLVAEGFQEARLLARKFITLYTLCRELLSKQDHYDWGLRAIKSVLVVAGALKRSDRLRPEDQVLMRALRDFNIPKIITDDLPVFMDLISDLFPALDVPRKRDPGLEKDIQEAAVDLTLQPEDKFILKVVQLQELLDVRHSVFIVGNTGTGKSQVWKTLFRTYQNQKRKPHYNDLNPKAVTNDELFGVINPTTREWKDGLFSVLIRDQTTLTGDGPKWMVMDGDIDPMWIESLNSVMDDNKVLTLASNERIALTPSMRLLFEIASLRTATPATVSRAGILFINVQDVGWAPTIASWLSKRDNSNDKTLLGPLFDRYVPSCLEALKSKFKKITPLAPIAHIMMLCSLLDCLINSKNLPTECPKEWYEMYFVFCAVWAFGSAIFKDQMADYRVEFSKWWVSEFRTVRFPNKDTVFHYFIDPETKEFLPWSELVQEFKLDYDIPLNATIVDTSETTRIRYFIDLLIENRNPIMLVGIAGVGKTVLINSRLSSLSDNYLVQNIPFNFYTTSEMLQRVLEKSLEKKAGRNYGPPGSKQMIYFIDDMNMPEVDLYGTVQPHTLIRQHLDYSHWYDRIKLTLKDIRNTQYISCMNPTAGSFTINPRLQRHFCVFAVSFPSIEPLTKIYTSILMEHLTLPENKFPVSLDKIVPNLATAAISFHSKISTILLPSVQKFHYVFNLRDLSNVFQGILFSSTDTVPNQLMLCRLWAHEITRVYCDKMVDFSDIDTFNKLLKDSFSKSGINEFKEEEIFVSPLIFSHFATGLGESKYLAIKTWEELSRLLEEALTQYNDLVSAMNLVLFEDAMYHVCRINRILEAPRGNALLVGVGGSGKQSLSRLASFISSLEVVQIQFRKGYSVNDLRMDLATIYFKAGVKAMGISFLMSDAQVADERFLVLINDMLASGEIPDLFADDEIENITGLVRNEVKGAGIIDTKENCWKFFINRIRTLIKVVLCFSPVGSTLRIRGRKFPALVNCTAIDWFHEWPQMALESVSYRFLSEIEALPKSLTTTVSLFMAYVHMSVNDISASYLANERRYNYTTPKSFLEQIALYSKLLTEKTNYNRDQIARLVNGLDKLASTSSQVAGLKETLAVQEVVVKEKNDAADVLIQVVGVEAEKVSKEKQFAAEEEKKVRAIEEDVSVKQKVCEEDLKLAEPALIAAQEALNTLNKNNLTELKSFGAPPEAVVNVCAAVLIMFSKKGKVPKDRSWKACKTLMGDVNKFLESLVKYDKEHIHPSIITTVAKYTQNPEFDPEKVMKKSQAAAGICAWVLNILKFYEVFLYVEPKRRALNAANAELSSARQRLDFLKEKITSLEEQLSKLTANFEQAVAVKLKCQAEADATALTIDLANRLVNGLASEKVRWRLLVASYKEAGKTLPGDILMITAFISYVGCFTRQYRLDLMHKFWFPKIEALEPKIDLSADLDPLGLLTDDAQIAKWNNEGLPSDRMSAENATILTNSARWPLMIDPQLQGIKWIKTRYGEDLKVIRLTQRNYMDVIENAVSEGMIVLLEYIGETVDAVLDPLLGRVLIHKGRAIKIGDHDVDYNVNFRLILQTKLANPHYKPEMQALTTLINFTVTRDGLEDQLLAEVVKTERPDLETLKTNLTTQQNTFKITLKKCEDDLLMRLSSAGDNILSDASIVYNLETTKKTADEVEIKVEEAKETTIKIDLAREMYRPVANRASLIYFILNELSKVNLLYQFSLKAFSVVFKKAIISTPETEDVTLRVASLIEQITYSTFLYTSRGLFECDKLIFLSHMSLQVLLSNQEIDREELDFLLRYPFQPGLTSPHEFITNVGWGGIKALTNFPDLQNLERDIEGSLKRWKNFIQSESPERDKFPGEYKNKTPLQKLCMMRALRPDRMVYAMRVFIEEKFGAKYSEARSIEFAKTYEETDNQTPVFFILSPGVDPLKDVERLGKTVGFGIESNNLHNVALGQGQEPVAEDAMDQAAEFGHWVILQNIHLIQRWLPILEKKLEINCENSHEDYRLFMSAEPSADPTIQVIPQGILESSIKITNEPPSGMFANLHKALDIFNQDTMEMCTKESEFKVILFALCYFHAVVNERKKFGAQGWNRKYPFNNGDLTISVNVLYNYLENSAKVPWENLRYLFGEIMYGGHITDDWDRRLCRTYLEVYMCPELVDGELNLAPGFPSPPNSDYEGYHKYIDHALPGESPYLCGLHPNAEIGYLTSSAEHLFRIIFELQPRDLGAAVGLTISREDKVKAALEDILDKVPPMFNIAEIMSRVENRTPYIIVAFQECERMNNLFEEIHTSLRELDLGLKGELTISSEMEVLEEKLFMDMVPDSWTKLAYPSQLGLGAWYQDLQLRLRELESWVTDFQLPAAVWLAGFFNPQSFLTAIMQSTARKNEWPLDKMCLQCDVTKKEKEEFTAPPREGAYIHSLIMEGARWDTLVGGIVDSKLGELLPILPVIYVKAITQDKQDLKNMYECPLYKTRERGMTFVWTFNLKTKEKPSKWTLAGVALILTA